MIWVFLIWLVWPSLAQATILASSPASGTCGTAVPTTDWIYAVSGESPDNRLYFRCATPVTGRTTYYQNDFLLGMLDAYNEHSISTVNMTPGTTYYMGMFVRYERIGGTDVFHDGNGFPNSSDKLFEMNGNTRILVNSGFPDWADCGTGGACDHHFTFGIYLSPSTCTGCIYEQIEPNVSPYDRTNFVLGNYERWYALVAGFTPSSGGAATNGRYRLWVNGVLTHDYQNIKTQDSTTPYLDVMRWSGTVAQPAYDAPSHYRQFDYFLFSDSLTDVTNAGLMSDPEAGGGGGGGSPTQEPIMFISNATGMILGITSVFQMLAISVYLWQQREPMIRVALNVWRYASEPHAMWWAWRYRRAVKRWQKAAPVMLEDRSRTTLDLTTKDRQTWR